MALSTAKAVTVLFDNAMEQLSMEMQMARTASVFQYDGKAAQGSNNIVWRQVEQQAPVKGGFDMTGQFGNVIELSYPAVLETPRNDAFQVRIDDFRDEQFVVRRGKAAAKKLNSDMNQRIATVVRDTGSMFYRKTLNTTAGSGYGFVSEADTIMTERQQWRGDGTSFFLNPRAYQLAAQDLAARGTLAGRPEKAYATGMVGKDIAGFDVYKSAYNQTLDGGATPVTTVGTTVNLAPLANQTVGGQVLPIDYRGGDIVLTSAAGFTVGDRVQFTGRNAVGLLDKTDTGQPMTFCIVGINANTITVYPRPIALVGGSITADERAYANIATQIVSGDVITRLNTDTLVQTNSFWANDSIEVIAGNIPFDRLGELSGFKVVNEALDNGVQLYMAYQGSIETLNLNVRLFTWYGVTNRDPSRNGIAINI